MVMKKNIFNFLIVLVFFVLCLDFYKKNRQIHLTTDYSETTHKKFYDNPYKKFYDNLDAEINEYTNKNKHFNRIVDIEKYNPLEDRKKLRWVFNIFHYEIKIIIKNISDKEYLGPKERISLYLYSSFIGVCFFLIFLFLYLSLKKLKKNTLSKDRVSTHRVISYLMPVYLLIIIYIFFYHFRGDFSIFAIFETLLLVAGFYFCLTKNIYVFALISLIAPLVRTSGLIIPFLYIFLDFSERLKINYKYLIFPILSISLYLFLNYDLIQYFFTEGFLVSSEKINGQITYQYFISPSEYMFDGDGSPVLGALQALFYNYFFLLIIPVIFFWEKKNKAQFFILILIILYLFMLLLGTAFEDMSERFMPASLIIIYCFLNIFKIPKIFK